MRKAIILLALIIICATAMLPSLSFTEDKATVRLARVIYAVAGDSPYEAKLALGTLVMNRVESPWFPNTLMGVLKQQQQFPAGERYDAESLRAAHAVIAGERAIAASALYYRSADASIKWQTAPICAVDNLLFYAQSENR